MNKTSIIFTDNEINLLEKDPKYNLHSRKHNWLTTLALEAETAITFLPSSDRDYFRKQVTNCIEHLHNNPTSPQKHTP